MFVKFKSLTDNFIIKITESQELYPVYISFLNIQFKIFHIIFIREKNMSLFSFFISFLQRANEILFSQNIKF